MKRLFRLSASFAALTAATVSAAGPSGPVAVIDTGAVRGTVAGGIESWKGIPFAAPPLGPLRWRAPQPAPRWTGVKDATAYGHDCMQVPFPSDAAPLGTPPAEDCLYLNVWRPASAARKLPVIVWIYGGGFVNGGASPPTYSGAAVAGQGTVFVSFNYRVGRFGTFAHPELTRENADGGRLGNYGFMDQIAALQWVRRNAAAFGGDAGNVTVIGESAGGFSVHMLLTSPLATGLFERAVIMSGGDGGSLGDTTPAGAETIGTNFAQSKGIAPGDPQVLAKLRALSADDVTSGLNMMALFRRTEPATFASPFVDGRVSVDGKAAYAAGRFAHVPVMVGATSADIGGKYGFAAGARSVAATLAAQGVPVYEYRFSYVAENAPPPPPPPPGIPAQTGAQHASDIPFFFDTQAARYGDTTTARDRQVGQTISRYIVNFARSGDPNGDGLPRWPRYDRAGDRIMDFAANGQAIAQKDPWGADIDARPPVK